MAALILRRSSINYRNLIRATPIARRFSSSAPWLLIEDSVEDNKVNNYYSLAEKRVRQPDAVNWTSDELKRQSGTAVKRNDHILVGSSHGCLAFYKPMPVPSRGLAAFKTFLYDPFTRCQVDLPLVPAVALDSNKLSPLSPSKANQPKKVILSCSPVLDNKEECRAIMSYGPEDRLAYCCPRHSTEWTPIGGLDLEEPTPTIITEQRQKRLLHAYRSLYTESPYPWVYYKDFVYSTTRKQLFCINKLNEIECWDLSDTCSPAMIWKKATKATNFCTKWLYLVFAERSNRLFLVWRTVMENIVPYGSARRYNFDRGKAHGYGPYQTVGFKVEEVIVDPDGVGNFEKGEIKIMSGTLDDMALFIGSVGDGFVIEKDEMVEGNNVEPNCIYYTDPKELTPPPWYTGVAFGGHDLGIYNYQTWAFSSLYKYGRDFRSFRRIQPTPTWFIPPFV